ncbi:MAG: class I SAM-dependent methyltransferase [Bacteroidales bacterium]|nr:class I SAM-dependent methyltransferase [Bacteroidales bacterium]
MDSKKMEKYILDHTKEEDSLLAELNRETYLKVIQPRMLSGHLQGKFLEMISCMINPKTILEIGTYTGYSAICLAKGLSVDGILHTIEINPEFNVFSEKYFERSGLKYKIQQHTGSALEIIPQMNEMFDLVFIDADKENYLNYYKMVFDKVKTGGFILADNALWDGKVLKNPNQQDKETKGIDQFNKYIQQDKRVENMLLPLRDGIMMIRKL